MAEDISNSDDLPIEEQPVSYFWIGTKFALALLVGYAIVWGVRGNQYDPIEVRSESHVMRYEMPDASFIWMNHNSYLKHPPEFDEILRMVNAYGEFWIELNDNFGGPMMFAVPGGVLQLNKGMAHVRAYEKEKRVEIHLMEGSGVFEIGHGWFQQITPGDFMSFDVKQQEIEVEKYATENFISWKTNELIFENTPLPEVIRDLDRHFEVRFQHESSAFADCRFSGNYPKPELDIILKDISASSGLVFNEEADPIGISEGNCSEEREEL